MSHVSHTLRPLDKLFVKDGRPLSLEDDSAASGLFPPPPSVVYGALRSAALAQAADLGAAIGTAADPAHEQRASLTGLAFAKAEAGATVLYFPAPADLVREKVKDDSADGQPAVRAALLAEDASLTSAPTPRLLGPADRTRPVEGVGGYVSGAGLAAYLRGEEVPPTAVIESSALYGSEPKLGIALDYGSRTTDDGLLYTMAMQRLHDGVTLAARTSGFGDSLPRLLRLGAEARAVETTTVRLDWPTAVPPSVDSFTLYLATPAVFKCGWLPDFLTNTDGREHTGRLGGATVRLLAASTGKYVPLGGWDIVAHRPKPMRKAVPAGAVYHFEIIDGTLDVDSVHGHPLASDFPHAGRADGDQVPYPTQGFGVAYVGRGPSDLKHTN